MKIIWGITGAGHLLRESVETLRDKTKKYKITVAYSAAGYEVANIYGVIKDVEEAANEIIREEDQGYSSPIVGRLAEGEYKAVIVSPCTANTVAKIVNGIADSLITNIVAQAVKSRTPVYVVPTDVEKIQETTLPTEINQKICRRCEPCQPQDACPEEAIYRDPAMRIDMLLCTGCRICVKECPYGAIISDRKTKIHIRDVDIDNTKKLSKTEGIQVFYDPKKIKIE